MSNSTTGQDLSKQYGAQAASTGSILTPTLQQMATNPQGFGQQQMNNFNTAALQSAGGSAAGQMGAGQVAAARTNNAGGYQGNMVAAGHDATSALSDAALGVQNQNAQLEQQQRAEGLQGLQNMYGTQVGAGENALGLSNSALNAASNAQNQTEDAWLNPLKAFLPTTSVSKQF